MRNVVDWDYLISNYPGEYAKPGTSPQSIWLHERVETSNSAQKMLDKRESFNGYKPVSAVESADSRITKSKRSSQSKSKSSKKSNAFSAARKEIFTPTKEIFKPPYLEEKEGAEIPKMRNLSARELL